MDTSPQSLLGGSKSSSPEISHDHHTELCMYKGKGDEGKVAGVTDSTLESCHRALSTSPCAPHQTAHIQV